MLVGVQRKGLECVSSSRSLKPTSKRFSQFTRTENYILTRPCTTSKLVWTESAKFKFDPLWMDWVKVKIKR